MLLDYIPWVWLQWPFLSIQFKHFTVCFDLFLYTMHVCVYATCMWVSTKARRGGQASWSLSYKWAALHWCWQPNAGPLGNQKALLKPPRHLSKLLPMHSLNYIIQISNSWRFFLLDFIDLIFNSIIVRECIDWWSFYFLVLRDVLYLRIKAVFVNVPYVGKKNGVF